MRRFALIICFLSSLLGFLPGEAKSKREWDDLKAGVLLDLKLGGDTNPLVLNDDLTDTETVAALAGDLIGAIRLRSFLPLGSDPDKRKKFLDIALSFDVGGIAQNDLQKTELLRETVGMTVDWDVFVCKTCFERFTKPALEENKLNRISLGLNLQRRVTDLGSKPFAAASRAESAIRFSFRSDESGELDNLDVYYRFDDYDAREEITDPRFDASGNYRSYGVRRKVYQKYLPGGKKLARYYCDRQGPFRTISISKYWSLYYGFERESRDTKGSEFSARFSRVYAGGSYPLCKTCGVAGEGYVEFGEGDFPRGSAVSPGVQREDRFGRLEMAFRKPLVRLAGKLPGIYQLDGRLGLGLEALDTNVPIFKYHRAFLFLGIEAAFGDSWDTLIPEGAGARTAEQSGSSGTSRPVVAEEVEPAN